MEIVVEERGGKWLASFLGFGAEEPWRSKWHDSREAAVAELRSDLSDLHYDLGVFLQDVKVVQR